MPLFNTDWTGWAWRQKGLNFREKLVLLALADVAHGRTGICSPSTEAMIKKTGLSKTRLLVTYNSLVCLRCMDVERHKDGDDHNRYKVRLLFHGHGTGD